MKKDKVEWGKYKFSDKILVFATKVMGLCFTRAYLCRRYDKLSAKYRGKNGRDRFFSNDLYHIFSLPYAKELFEDGTVSCAFEGKSYRMYKRADDILRAQYGDYMQLPPEEKRHFEHLPELP